MNLNITELKSIEFGFENVEHMTLDISAIQHFYVHGITTNLEYNKRNRVVKAKYNMDYMRVVIDVKSIKGTFIELYKNNIYKSKLKEKDDVHYVVDRLLEYNDICNVDLKDHKGNTFQFTMWVGDNDYYGDYYNKGCYITTHINEDKYYIGILLKDNTAVTEDEKKDFEHFMNAEVDLVI